MATGEALPTTFEHRAIVALFTAMMRARTPRERQQFAAASEHELRGYGKQAHRDRASIERFLASRGEDTSDEAIDAFAARVRDAWEKDEIVISVPLDRSLGTLMRLAVEMSATVNELSWWILRPSGDSQFLTSDCPVAMYDVALGEGRGNAFQSSPLAETTLPLALSACLLMLPSGPEIAERLATEDEVRHINARTYAWAERWVFGPTEESVREVHDLARRDTELMAGVTPRPYFVPPKED